MVWDYYRELETINYDISKYSVIARCPVGSELRIKTYWDASPPFMQIESYIGFNFKNPSSSAPFLISSTETFEYNLNNHRMLENFIKHANLITAEINGNNVVCAYVNTENNNRFLSMSNYGAFVGDSTYYQNCPFIYDNNGTKICFPMGINCDCSFLQTPL